MSQVRRSPDEMPSPVPLSHCRGHQPQTHTEVGIWAGPSLHFRASIPPCGARDTALGETLQALFSPFSLKSEVTFHISYKKSCVSRETASSIF